jgi:hypothetical protein
MQKLTIIIALAVIALALGTTTTTTAMQIQPAYSQPSHCFTVPGDFFSCVTPGKDASTFGCGLRGCSGDPIDPNQAGQIIGNCHTSSVRGFGECTVTKTPPPTPPGPE